MSRVSTKQRHDGYIQLEKDIGTDAHFRSFLEGICYAEKIIASEKQDQPEPVQDEEPFAYRDPFAYYDMQEKRWEFARETQFDVPQSVVIPKLPLYLHPEQKVPFVRLTDEELKECWGFPYSLSTDELRRFARAIEDALEEKNK